MKIKIEKNNALGLHTALNQNLHTIDSKRGFELKTQITNGIGDLNLISYEFDKGFNFNILKGDISSLLELDFEEDKNNYLRFFFVRKGELIHNVSPNIRYRLTDNFSCMVAAKGGANQLFTFPVQNDIELLFLQVETQSFSIDLKSDFFSLPKQIGNVLMNKKMDDHFIYHSLYTLDISETISEIVNTEKEGMVKRFFLESKALELLWLQSEQFDKETSEGYSKKVLRKQDVPVIKKAKEYIHNNLEKKLTLSLISREIGTNETKLKTGFRKLYGKTFTDIIRLERLNKAKALIDDGDLSIKEIANFCGYKSTSMFSTRFKQRFGTTPGKYKNS